MKTSFSSLLILLVAFFCATTLAAQVKTVTGVVSDKSGPLPGASVLVQGTSRGTETDFDGRFSIDVSPEDILVFSYVGMKTQRKQVEDYEVINIKLNFDNELDEVVVIGFGEKTRKALTTSVAKVDSNEINNVSTPTISGALQGAAVGLQVSQNSGAPGGGFSVRIRGAASINGNNDPLYVVDGVPIVTGAVGRNDTGGQSNDLLANLNFADIESVQVLKDAAAAAIYGARGANGVVLITTKRGKIGKPTVSINSYLGFQNPIKKPEIFTAGEFYKQADKAFIDDFGAPLMSLGRVTGYSPLNDDSLNLNSVEELYAADFGDNYVDAIYKENPALVTQTDVAVSGGTQQGRYYLNFSNFEQDGVIHDQDFLRKSITFNTNFKVNDKIDIETSSVISQSKQNRISADNSVYSPLTNAIVETPGYNLFNPDGSYNINSFRFSNPLQNAKVDKQKSTTYRLFSNVGGTYRINSNLNFKSKISLERVDFKELSHFPSTTRRGQPTNGTSSKDINLINRWNLTNTLTYNKTCDEYKLTALLGAIFEGESRDISNISSSSVPIGFTHPNAGAVARLSPNFVTENKLFSYLARVGGSYLQKLFLEVTLRTDASSVFGKNNKVGYFPAFSTAYIISEDDWFKNETVTNFKLRGSWGKTGNSSGIGDFGSVYLAGVDHYVDRGGISISQLNTPDLSWETTTQTNLGVDLTFFNKVNFSYDYFIKNTNDVLQFRPLRNSSGFTAVASNIGKIRNTGHEFSISSNIINSENFTWYSQFQAASLKNEVIKLQVDSNGNYLPTDIGYATRIAVGQPLGAFFGLEADGLWQQGDDIPQALRDIGVGPGDIKFKDLNGDGNINTNDRTFIGNPLPKWTGNFRNNLKYKNVDFSFNFQFEQDKDIFNISKVFASTAGPVVFNKFADQANYWTEDNTDTNIPRPRASRSVQPYNAQNSSFFVEDGSYIRLKSISLGYTLNEILGEGSTLRLYVGADNLLTFTDYSGLDPEVNSYGAQNNIRGNDFFTQGLNKTYKFGFNFKF